MAAYTPPKTVLSSVVSKQRDRKSTHDVFQVSWATEDVILDGLEERLSLFRFLLEVRRLLEVLNVFVKVLEGGGEKNDAVYTIQHTEQLVQLSKERVHPSRSLSKGSISERRRSNNLVHIRLGNEQHENQRIEGGTQRVNWLNGSVVFMSTLLSDLLLYPKPSIPFVGHRVCDETVGENDYRNFESHLSKGIK
jgi:hypothetical protein